MAMAVQHSVPFADYNKLRNIPPLKIEEPLQDIIVKENSAALIECKLAGFGTMLVTWHKDGRQIVPSQRVKMTNYKQFCRLEISSVSVDDIGVYLILCTNSINQVFSKACLYVSSLRNFHNNDGILYMNHNLSESVRVLRHLVNLTLEIGERIELEVELSTESIEDFQWYKSNRIIHQDTRIIILSDSKISTLSILRAQETDSGLYHIVVKTKQGIVSSFADVIVNNSVANNEAVPTIEEPLPDEVEVNEKEEIRLMCKAKLDDNTMTQWLKNGVPIKMNNKIRKEDYGNKYIGLRIIDPKQNDTGEYTVMLRHIVTGHFDSSSCFVTFNASLTIDIPNVKVVKPLDTIVGCFGSKVTLRCSFDLRDPKYFYVVWYVGRFRAERTNHRFNVVSNSSEFFLVIKKLEPDMAGLAVCELRRALPSRKSVLVNATSSNVAIVPPSFFNQELNLHTQKRRRIYYRMSLENETDDSESLNKDVFSDETSDQQLTDEIIATKDGTIMEIDFCRLQDDGFCFMDVLNQRNEMCYSSLTVCDKDFNLSVTEKSRNIPKTLVIKWNAPRLNVGYAIDYWLPHGFYLCAGVASLPKFELEHPGVEIVIKLRIRAVKSVRRAGESSVCIVLPPDTAKILTNICELKSMVDFDTSFTKTGEVIGCGAFGSVVLVRDIGGDHYAAKLLKTRTQKKRDYAIREFNMMKRLKHPNLVELVDAFMAKDSFVLVMDYLWGGELFDRIIEEEHIKEVDVVPYVRQTCEALQYLHAQNIVHLDVKPENIICLNPNSRQVKLIDFGLARVLDEVRITRAIYGTKDYVAPEVLNYERLTLFCDMWSLGVVTYMLLSGVMPFAGETWQQRSANITGAFYDYQESAFIEISSLAKNFVDNLLVLNPAKRMNATMALNHQWIVEGPPKGANAGHMRRARENLKSYMANYRACWQRAGNVLIAAHRLRNQIGQRSSSEKDSEKASLQLCLSERRYLKHSDALLKEQGVVKSVN